MSQAVQVYPELAHPLSTKSPFPAPLPKPEPSADVQAHILAAHDHDRKWTVATTRAQAQAEAQAKARWSQHMTAYRNLLIDLIDGKDINWDRLDTLRATLNKNAERVVLDARVMAGYLRYVEARKLYNKLSPLVQAAKERVETLRDERDEKLSHVPSAKAAKRNQIAAEFRPLISQAEVDRDALSQLASQANGFFDAHAAKLHLELEYREEPTQPQVSQAIDSKATRGRAK